MLAAANQGENKAPRLTKIDRTDGGYVDKKTVAYCDFNRTRYPGRLGNDMSRIWNIVACLSTKIANRRLDVDE